MKIKLFKKKYDEDTRIKSDYFRELRRSEYFRLDNLAQTYLDYTGSNLYPQTLLDIHYHLLSEGVYGNPHSNSPCSLRSSQLIEESREKVISFFEAKDYECIFTPNATGAINIISNCYPFSSDSALLLTVDNHNSVNGMREVCKSKGGDFEYVNMMTPDFNIDNNDLTSKLHKYKDKKFKLFAYPAQSNVTGAKHNLNKINIAQKNGWNVLLDAAAFVPTSKLSLKKIQPEFVSIAFYKIFGFPTGIGCLLVRKDMMSKLNKDAFSGGNVKFVSVTEPGYRLLEDHSRFEDGTPDFLGIPMVKHGLDFIEKISMDRISYRIEKLTQWIMEKLQNQYHDNGKPLIMLYGPTNVSKRGGTFLINFFDQDGKQYPYEFIEQKAIKNNICLRAGCFCNPGIDEIRSQISEDELKEFYTTDESLGYSSWSDYMVSLRGALRISIGIATIQEDIHKFFKMTNKLKNKSYTEHSLI